MIIKKLFVISLQISDIFKLFQKRPGICLWFVFNVYIQKSDEREVDEYFVWPANVGLLLSNQN